jgi:hypothetical protein
VQLELPFRAKERLNPLAAIQLRKEDVNSDSTWYWVDINGDGKRDFLVHQERRGSVGISIYDGATGCPAPSIPGLEGSLKGMTVLETPNSAIRLLRIRGGRRHYDRYLDLKTGSIILTKSRFDPKFIFDIDADGTLDFFDGRYGFSGSDGVKIFDGTSGPLHAKIVNPRNELWGASGFESWEFYSSAHSDQSITLKCDRSECAMRGAGIGYRFVSQPLIGTALIDSNGNGKLEVVGIYNCQILRLETEYKLTEKPAKGDEKLKKSKRLHDDIPDILR